MKILAEDEQNSTELQSHAVAVTNVKSKKKKRKINSDCAAVQRVENDGSKPKKKKLKKRDEIPCNNVDKLHDVNLDKTKAKSKKRKKKKTGDAANPAEDEVSTKLIDHDSEAVTKTIAKKESTCTDDQHQLKKKKAKKMKIHKESSETKVTNEIVGDQRVDISSSDNKKTKTKKAKSKKKQKDLSDSPNKTTKNDPTSEKTEVTKSSKKKRKSKCEETLQTCEDGVKIIPEKKTKKRKLSKNKHLSPNTIEDDNQIVKPDQHKESSTNPATENKSCGLGQWITSDLGDAARQDKFFRLLGGKKKQNSSQSSNNFSSLARNYEQSKQLNVALESQFNNTMAFNLLKRSENNKSKGLGFVEDLAKGKKFHININKSNSIKFDD